MILATLLVNYSEDSQNGDRANSWSRFDHLLKTDNQGLHFLNMILVICPKTLGNISRRAFPYESLKGMDLWRD